jgi:hypothetical protein
MSVAACLHRFDNQCFKGWVTLEFLVRIWLQQSTLLSSQTLKKVAWKRYQGVKPLGCNRWVGQSCSNDSELLGAIYRNSEPLMLCTGTNVSQATFEKYATYSPSTLDFHLYFFILNVNTNLTSYFMACVWFKDCKHILGSDIMYEKKMKCGWHCAIPAE